MAQKEAGNACGWSGARLSYIENALQNVTEDDLDLLLSLYKVPEKKRGPYYEAIQRTQEKGWWERYQRFMPAHLPLVLAFEQGAVAIRSFHPVLIHGLLQIPEYAAAVLAADVAPRSGRQIDELVTVRAERQQIVSREQDPVELHVVLDEATLRRVARDAATMASQMDHLAVMAQRPNVTVQVLPFERGVHTYALGAFTIFDFPWDTDPGVVYIELRGQALYLEELQDIDSYTLAFQHVSNQALDPDESMRKLKTMSKEYMRS